MRQIFEGRVSALSIQATQAVSNLYVQVIFILLNSVFQTESAEAWEAVLEAMSKFDDKQISDWMDDLQNLLTFVRTILHFFYPFTF